MKKLALLLCGLLAFAGPARAQEYGTRSGALCKTADEAYTFAQLLNSNTAASDAAIAVNEVNGGDACYMERFTYSRMEPTDRNVSGTGGIFTVWSVTVIGKYDSARNVMAPIPTQEERFFVGFIHFRPDSDKPPI